MEDLSGIGKLAESELAKRAYEDALSKPAVQIGKLTSDTIQAFRLFTAPIQLLATAQERFEVWLDGIRKTVPVERQIEAAPEIAGPILMNLRFMNDENELKNLYLRLLAHAIDRESCDQVHPGFIKIVEHLSPFDAIFLQKLCQHLPLNRSVSERESFPCVIALQNIFNSSNWSMSKIQSSLDLLSGFSVIRFQAFHDLDSRRPGIRVLIELTEFGKRFVDVCLPETDTPHR